MTETQPGKTELPRQGFGIGIVLFAGVFIGLQPNAAKIAYQEGPNPLAVITLRCIVGMIGLGIYIAVRRWRFRIGWPAFGYSAATGVAHALVAFGMMGAVAYIDVSSAILIVFFYPFLVAVFGHIRGESRLTPPLIACIAMALVGLALALAVKPDALNAVGIGLALIGAVATAVMVLAVVGATKQIGAVAANFYMTVWASLYFISIAIFGPTTWVMDGMAFPESVKGWIAIVGTGVTLYFGLYPVLRRRRDHRHDPCLGAQHHDARVHHSVRNLAGR